MEVSEGVTAEVVVTEGAGERVGKVEVLAHMGRPGTREEDMARAMREVMLVVEVVREEALKIIGEEDTKEAV